MNEHVKAVLDHQYLMLDEILTTINKNTFLEHPEPGKWSVFENIAHLGRYSEMFYLRMQEIQHKNNPQIESYKADDEPGFIEWCGKSFDLVFADFYAKRETLINFFTFLSDDELKRTGVHIKYGELTTAEWLQFYLLHEAHHLFIIFKLLHRKK